MYFIHILTHLPFVFVVRTPKINFFSKFLVHNTDLLTTIITLYIRLQESLIYMTTTFVLHEKLHEEVRSHNWQLRGDGLLGQKETLLLWTFQPPQWTIVWTQFNLAPAPWEMIRDILRVKCARRELSGKNNPLHLSPSYS